MEWTSTGLIQAESRLATSPASGTPSTFALFPWLDLPATKFLPSGLESLVPAAHATSSPEILSDSDLTGRAPHTLVLELVAREQEDVFEISPRGKSREGSVAKPFARPI